MPITEVELKTKSATTTKPWSLTHLVHTSSAYPSSSTWAEMLMGGFARRGTSKMLIHRRECREWRGEEAAASPPPTLNAALGFSYFGSFRFSLRERERESLAVRGSTTASSTQYLLTKIVFFPLFDRQKSCVVGLSMDRIQSESDRIRSESEVVKSDLNPINPIVAIRIRIRSIFLNFQNLAKGGGG